MAILRDTHRFLHFNLAHTADNGEDNHYVDIAKLLSQANRRSYRQGMVYHIANIVFDDADGDADIDVCTLPQNWLTQAAWKLGFTAWFEQQTAAMKALGERELGRWSDFKIAMNSDNRTDTDQAVLIDVNGNTFPTGDWDYSHFQIPNDGGAAPTEADINMLGVKSGSYPAYTTVSLLEELEKALEVPTEDPSFDSDADKSVYGLMSSLVNDSEVIDKVIDDIDAENDFPPYNANVVPGSGTAGSGRPSSPWVARTCMIKGGSGTASPVAAVGGFAAPCGLLMIETKASGDYSSNSNTIGVTIELVPGEYKGVHAYPMRGGGF